MALHQYNPPDLQDLRNHEALECHNREPDYISNRPGDDKEMIDPLRPPFEPIPPEVMARVLHALALSQPIQPIPTSPLPPTPEQRGEETQPLNDHPNLPVDNASPTPLVLEPTEALLNGDTHNTIQGRT